MTAFRNLVMVGLALATGVEAPAAASKPDFPAATSSASAPCDAVAQAGISLGSSVSATDVCTTVVGDWSNRDTVKDPPRHYTLTVENDQFASQLAATIHAVKKGQYKVAIVDFATTYVRSEKQLRDAVAPAYNEGALGVWLDRIGDHDGVKELKTGEAFAIAPLLFEWVGKPVLKFLIDTFFKRDPYGDAKKVDAYVVTYSSSPRTGTIARICFVKRGAAINDSICPRN